MAKKFHFPIAAKLIVIITATLLVANLIVAHQASELFKEVSGKREEDINRSQSDTHASEVNAKLQNITEKSMILAALLLKSAVNKKSKNRNSTNSTDDKLLLETFERDQDLVSIGVFEKVKGKVNLVDRLIDNAYLKGYKLDSDYLRIVNEKVKFPLAKVFSGDTILRNRSLPKGAPLLTIGIPLAKDKLGKITQVILADIRLQSLQEGFSKKTVRTEYLIDPYGKVVAHSNEKFAIKRKSFKKYEIVKKALKSKLPKGQLRYYNKSTKQFYRSAFSKTRNGLLVISEAPESIILEPAKQVRIEVMYVAMIVISSAIFIIFLFSTSISKPLKNLVLMAKEISQGNFMVSARSVVRSRDEVGELATAFDGMVEGLKERDKVKNLFSKFQGSTVTDEMLNSEVAAGVGKRIPVAIFFSDIRGFTAISESLAPEQVVEMLNEYFNAMVKVIENNEGWVNKYIGDAIMAVWGAPKKGEDDVFKSVNACIEMRQSLNELNKVRIDRGEKPLMIGMGVHFGEAIAGTIGSDERIEYTVIGDSVNLAARIEASTKAFGTDFLVSEAVSKLVADRFIMEEAGSAKVKGKTDALKMFKVRGFIRDGKKLIVKTPYSDYEATGADKVEVV